MNISLKKLRKTFFFFLRKYFSLNNKIDLIGNRYCSANFPVHRFSPTIKKILTEITPRLYFNTITTVETVNKNGSPRRDRRKFPLVTGFRFTKVLIGTRVKFNLGTVQISVLIRVSVLSSNPSKTDFVLYNHYFLIGNHRIHIIFHFQFIYLLW